MINHFLLTLTAEQEDRVLTKAMRPGAYELGCLVATALGGAEEAFTSAQRDFCNRRWPSAMGRWMHKEGDERRSVENRFDDLCERFGAPRVNAAIRARVLRNRLWRALGAIRGAPSEAVETAP